MAYEYLQETTYTSQLQDQEKMLEYLQEKSYADTAYEDTGDSDLIEIGEQELEAEAQEPEQEQDNTDLAPDLDQEDPQFDDTDNELLAFLFSNSETPNRQFNTDVSFSQSSVATPRQGENPYASTLFNNLNQKYGVRNLGIWGDKSHQARKSDHNTGDALDVDFGGDQEKRQSIVSDLEKDPKTKYIISNGKIWNPSISNKWRPYNGENKHTGHIHVSLNRQFGGYGPLEGNTLVADTEDTLRQGLNLEGYDSAVLNLKGSNTIRGLDSKQPVAVTDGSKYKILKGPQDTAKFNGTVYEKRI